MAGPLARLYATLGLDAREFDDGLGKAQKSVSGFGKATDLAIAGAAGAIVGGVGLAVNAAREWETAFTGVKKTIDTTGMSVEEQTKTFGLLEDQLLDMSTTLGTTSTELAGLAEAGGALGVATQDIDEFVRVTAMLGATTDVVAQDAAMSLGKIGTVLRLTADDYDNFGNTLVDLGNKGASTEAEILETANRIAGTASAVGLTANEMLGWSAALANVGILPEAAGSSFQKFAYTVQTAALAGGNKLDLLAQIAGQTSAEFQQSWGEDANAALASVVVGLGNLDEAAAMNAKGMLGFDDIRISDFITKLTGNVDNLTDSLGISEQAWQDNTAMFDEFGKRADTVDFKIQNFWGQVNRLGITIGNALLPPLTMTVEHLGNLVGILGDAAAAFPAVTNVVTPLVTALAGLVGLRFGARFLGFGGAFDDLIGKGLGKAWRGAGRLARPIIAASGRAAGVVYAGAAIAVEKFMSIMSAAWTAMGRPGSQVIAAAIAAGTNAGAAFAGASGGAGFMGALMAAIGAISLPVVIAVTWKLIFQEPLDKLITDTFGAGSPADMATGKALDQMRERVADKPFKPIFEWPWEAGGFFHNSAQDLADEQERMIKEAFERIDLKGIAMSYAPDLDALVRDMGNVNVPSGLLARLGEAVKGQLSSALDPDAIDKAFKAAKEAIKEGFGNIKQLLANPPQIISLEDRLANLARKRRKSEDLLAKARRVNDPFNTRLYISAIGSIDERTERLRRRQGEFAEGAANAHRKAGRDVKDVWTKAADKQGEQATRGANKSISEAERIKTSIDAMDLVSTGKNLMLELAQGIGEGTQSVVDAASLAASAIAQAFGSVTPAGALAGGAVQSNGITIAGNVYGGAAGLRQLEDDITRARRPTRRHRD